MSTTMKRTVRRKQLRAVVERHYIEAVLQEALDELRRLVMAVENGTHMNRQVCVERARELLGRQEARGYRPNTKRRSNI